MEAMGLSADFWRGKRVLVTGHTGFKGSWLTLWLQSLGAQVSGFSLDPSTEPSLFELARVSEGIDSRIGDLRDLPTLLASPNPFGELATRVGGERAGQAKPACRLFGKAQPDRVGNAGGHGGVCAGVIGCIGRDFTEGHVAGGVYEFAELRVVLRWMGVR